jgi:hypothetical protein
MDDTLRDTLLEVIENSLDAQLRAVRRLRSSSPGFQRGSTTSVKAGKESMSHIDMAYDILANGQALHINEILAAIKKRFKTAIDRESLVSAISKRVVRGDRFRRAGKNTFALLTPQS